MMREAPFDRRLGLTIAVASASVTLAIGVTCGALLGWVQPPRSVPPAETVPTSPAGSDAPPSAEAARVILVPVQPASLPPPARARGRRVTAPTKALLASASDRPRKPRHEDDRYEDDDDDED